MLDNDLADKDTVDKCFTECMMLLIAKANRLEKVEYLMGELPPPNAFGV